MTPQPSSDAEGGALIGRLLLDKHYGGDLIGSGIGQMLGVRTAADGSAGYVAMEVVEGVLAGRIGSFVLQHTASMRRGAQTMDISVVPDSGTGALEGLTGTLGITVTATGHEYDFDYSLPD